MTIEYDMTTGEIISNPRPETSITAAFEPDKIVSASPTLQLVQVETESEPKTMPHDMSSISISGFLKQQ